MAKRDSDDDARPNGPPSAPARYKDPLITTWSRTDIVANQRTWLKEMDRLAPSRAKRTLRGAGGDELAASEGQPERPAPWVTSTGSKIPAPPGIAGRSSQDSSVYSVYRYTRGIGDLSNSGIGYGETTIERRGIPLSGGQRTLKVTPKLMQRTRSGRQPLDDHTAEIAGQRPSNPPPSSGSGAGSPAGAARPASAESTAAHAVDAQSGEWPLKEAWNYET